ncbi:MAG: hypothetical protein ACOC2W_03500 [bacterium]
MNKLERIILTYQYIDFIVADGFDDALIGVDENGDRLVYSVQKCIDILIKRDGMKYDEALEYFDFNIRQSYVGDKTPIWVNDLFF